jgi:hypothetical protein
MIPTTHHLLSEVIREGYAAHLEDFGGGIKHVVVPDPKNAGERFIVTFDESSDGEQRFVVYVDAEGLSEPELMIENATFQDAISVLFLCGIPTA